MLEENEIIVNAHPVKYHDIEYHESFVTVTQNRTRRRVYKGWYFEDTGAHIYISSYMSDIFQHKIKVKKFIINTVTKEWKPAEITIITKHVPEKKETKEFKPDKELKR